MYLFTSVLLPTYNIQYVYHFTKRCITCTLEIDKCFKVVNSLLHTEYLTPPPHPPAHPSRNRVKNTIDIISLAWFELPDTMSLRYADTSLPDLLGRPSLRHTVR